MFTFATILFTGIAIYGYTLLIIKIIKSIKSKIITNQK